MADKTSADCYRALQKYRSYFMSLHHQTWSRIELRMKYQEMNGMGRGQCEGEKRREINWEFVADALKTERGQSWGCTVCVGPQHANCGVSCSDRTVKIHCVPFNLHFHVLYFMLCIYSPFPLDVMCLWHVNTKLQVARGWVVYRMQYGYIQVLKTFCHTLS